MDYYYTMKPMDVLLFKNHKPFNADNLFASSYTDPNPSTVAGLFKWMIVNQIARQKKTSIRELARQELTPDQISLLQHADYHIKGTTQVNKLDDSFYLKNIFLIRNEEPSKKNIFCPTPFDLVYYETMTEVRSTTERLSIPKFKLLEDKIGVSWDGFAEIQNLNTPIFGSKDLMMRKSAEKIPYINLESLEEYMNGKVPKININSNELDKPELEHRAQIKIDNQYKTTEENSLFFVEYLRLHASTSYLVAVSSTPEIDEIFSMYDYVNLGGERKLVKINKSESKYGQIIDSLIEWQDKIIAEINKTTSDETTYFSILFLTFVDLSELDQLKNYLSASLTSNSSESKEGEIIIKDIISDKPRLIGGFDYKKKQMKPLRFFYPPGTVIHLQTNNRKLKKVGNILNCSKNKNDRKNGYGSFVVCKIKEKN